MLSKVQFHVRGVLPLMVHNAQLADPRNRWARAIKAISGKRKKTEEDYLEMSRLEFLGGLYLDKAGRPCLPGEGIDAAIASGARKSRQGPAAESGILTEGTWPVLYDGPKDPEKMWADGRFVDVRGALVEGKRIMRTRPVFPEWELKWVTSYDPELLNASDLVRWVDVLGRQIGLYEYRPRFGRFEVLESKELAEAA